jgi:hypothetical protein
MANEKKESLVKARVLMRFTYEGKAYVCDDIFTGDAAAIKLHKESGNIDAHPDAVKYAESLK